MNHDIVVGIDHPVAPWFVAEKLTRVDRRITCLTGDAGLARVLPAAIEALLEQRAATRSEDALSRLAIVDSVDTGTAADDTTRAALFVFLSSSEIADLSRHPNPRLAQETLAALSVLGAAREVHIVADLLDLSREQPIEHALERIERAFRAGAPLRVHCLGPYVCESSGASTVQAIADQLLDIVYDVKRRSAEYFSRYPMQLRLAECGAIQIMSAMNAAVYLAGADQTTRPGGHVVFGGQTWTVAEIVERVDRSTGTNIRVVGADQSGRVDLASSIATKGLREIAQRCRISVETVRSAGLTQHELPTEMIDMSIPVDCALAAKGAESEAMQKPFAAVPGLQRKQSAEPSVRYFRCGTGTDAILLVNAFGLSLDFWQMLASALHDRFSLIAVDRPDSADGPDSVPSIYYSADDYAGQYVVDVAGVLSAEAIERCHVVSWCSGAKLAIELADALPGVIRSLSLLAPSFAGIDAAEGCDSAYERNLHTMCKIVRQTPKAAGSMANSMMAIMTKAGNDLDRFRADAKDSIDVLELPDAHQLPLLYRPFASAQNMVEFSRQLMHFRLHDITPKLRNETLQVPVMLVTGRADTTTSAARAKDICSRLGNIVGFELEGSSHYLIHQNYGIVAELIKAFTTDGIDMRYTNPRVESSVFREMAETVSGEV